MFYNSYHCSYFCVARKAPNKPQDAEASEADLLYMPVMADIINGSSFAASSHVAFVTIKRPAVRS